MFLTLQNGSEVAGNLMRNEPARNYYGATVKQSKENARFESPKAESSLLGLWNEQNENVSSKSKEQITSQDNKPISTSNWRDESVDANTNEWGHLGILMEEERKNKVIKPVKVYKCKK